MLTVKNLSPTIIPKSDQLNADQLLGGAMTIKVTEVSVSESPDQPVIIHYENENGRPFKPCKSMRKVLIFAWGDDGTKWAGRSMTLFNDPEVKWAGVKVGGIRISHMSDIERDLQLQLTATRGKKEPFIIKRLNAEPLLKPAPTAPTVTDADLQSARNQLATAAPFGLDTLKNCWQGLTADVRKSLGQDVLAEYKRIAENPQPESDVSDDDGEFQMTKTDYCFLMLTVIGSPIISNGWRVLLGICWLILAVLNFIFEVR